MNSRKIKQQRNISKDNRNLHTASSRRSYQNPLILNPGEVRTVGAQNPANLLSWQQQIGHQAVTGLLQKMQAAGQDLDESFVGAVKTTRGVGQCLPPQWRGNLEEGLGASFNNVRLHIADQADTLNRRIDARAFTIGTDIYFRRGEYKPFSSEGQCTLRHELTHVVQQGGRFLPHLRFGPKNDAHEQEAQRVSRGDRVPQSRAIQPGCVQRTGYLKQDIPEVEKTLPKAWKFGDFVGDSSTDVILVTHTKNYTGVA